MFFISYFSNFHIYQDYDEGGALTRFLDYRSLDDCDITGFPCDCALTGSPGNYALVDTLVGGLFYNSGWCRIWLLENINWLIR
jgi:hypothetical protein